MQRQQFATVADTTRATVVVRCTHLGAVDITIASHIVRGLLVRFLTIELEKYSVVATMRYVASFVVSPLRRSAAHSAATSSRAPLLPAAPQTRDTA